MYVPSLGAIRNIKHCRMAVQPMAVQPMAPQYRRHVQLSFLIVRIKPRLAVMCDQHCL